MREAKSNGGFAPLYYGNEDGEGEGEGEGENIGLVAQKWCSTLTVYSTKKLDEGERRGETTA